MSALVSWRRRAVATLLVAFFSPGLASKCLDDAVVERLVEGFPTAPVTGIPPDISLDDAYCTQEKYVALLGRKMGAPVGYKTAFTGKALQQRFAISGPAYGVLFAPMFIPDGSSIRRDFGYRPMIEPDLMVVVKDAGIMDATTELEAAAHLSTVHAYMELVALQFAEHEKITGSAVVAINAAATRMVMGPGVTVEATPEFVQAMAAMQSVFADETGAVLQRAPGSALLGNPLRAVLWLVEETRRRGMTIKAGDRLSLGGLGKQFPLSTGDKTYTYTLSGLPGGPVSTSVRIE